MKLDLSGLAHATIQLGFLDRFRVKMRNVDLRPAWDAARKPLRADQREHAKKMEGPGGSWPARASTTRTRTGARKRARRMLGRLPTANKYTRTRTAATLSSTVSWSQIHQEGGRAGRGARIPARPFMWIGDKTLDVIAGLISRGIAYMMEVG